MIALPSGTVTFLFTDLEGSSRLWEEHPDAMKQALARHDEILRSAVIEHDGYVVKATGDGLHAAFATARAAVDAAVAAQSALGAEAWPLPMPLRVRMGVHSGAAELRDGDYYGTAVNRAARIMSVAHGDQIVLSLAAEELVRDGAVEVIDLGEHRLKDLSEPERVFQVVHTGLRRQFPPLRSLDVVPTNLPTVRTELIGRGEELRTLSELVVRERLVTLTGVGGVGKTRLALAVSAAVAPEFADGCWLVELAPVADGDEVVTAVAAAMRAPATDLGGLVSYLADRRVLIVLDNCEHVLDAAAELVDVLLADGVDVQVLVTSREPLGLDGEQVRRVASLEVPDAAATLGGSRSAAAVRLFAERAAAVADGFTIDADNLDAVVEICRHLDGIPLAIELAAARARAMPVEEIERRLDERFRLLAGGSRRAQERHRTLLATVSWSHDLCSDDEKVVFRRLAVFPATFGLDAAEAIVGDAGIDVVGCVLRLVDRSLVVYESDTSRYRLLETLRQYGADRLAEAAETESIRERHARWFLSLAERVGSELAGARFLAASTELGVELDNLRATVDWCVESGWWRELAAMCLQLWTFFEQDAPVDGTAWLQLVVQHGSDIDAQMVLDALGVLAWLLTADLGDIDQGDALGEQCISQAADENLQESPWAWCARAMAALFRAQHAENHYASERAFDAAERRGDERASIVSLSLQITALASLGESERSATVAVEALRRAEVSGHPVTISAALISMCSGFILGIENPDFAAAFDALARHRDGLRAGTVNDMWLDIFTGETLFGLGRPGAVEHLARAARSADRLNMAPALDRALRILAIAAAEAGLTAHATTLTAYTEAALRPYRVNQPGQVWIQSRLDHALAGLTPETSHPHRHRREIINLVNDLEASLTKDAPASPSTTI
jgi:predicted ATPase/class 3 adenylate cyclase